MENRGIVKVSQVRHVFAFFVLGGVDLTDEVFLEVLGLFVGYHLEDESLCAISRDFFGIFCFVAVIFRHAGKYRARDIFL